MKMRVASTAIAGVAVVVTLFGWSLLSADGNRAPPPLTGWMENFTLAETRPEAPTSVFQDRDGKSYTLEGFRGKVVLVNFWATWCGPCIREMPSLNRLQAKLGGETFTVLALSQDRDGWAKIGPFLTKHDLAGLPTYHDPKARFARAAKARSLPTSVLYGKDGREIGRLTGHAEWDSDEAVALVGHYLEE